DVYKRQFLADPKNLFEQAKSRFGSFTLSTRYFAMIGDVLYKNRTLIYLMIIDGREYAKLYITVKNRRVTFNLDYKGPKLSELKDYLSTSISKLRRRRVPSNVRIPAYVTDFDDMPKVAPVSEKVKEYEKLLEEKYNVYPLYLLFVGCMANYDEIGVLGFLEYLYKYGDNLTDVSPRVKIVDNVCCGFNKYISGDLSGARNDVAYIEKLLENNSAEGIYFLCPEGFYVYTRFGGKKGFFGYDVIKPYVRDKVYGCTWAKKIGVDVDYQITHKTTQKEGEAKSVCPFITYKLGVLSVYTRKVIEVNIGNLDKILVDEVLNSINTASLNSAKEIASNLSALKTGNPDYFVKLVSPIIRKKFIENFRQSLKEYETWIKSLDPMFLKTIVSKVYEMSEKTLDEEKIDNLVKLIGKNASYENREIAGSDEFVKYLKIALKSVVEPKLIQSLFDELLVNG
ncbi:hypothetical protein, partial [Sulfolobus acidocaldarius]|uniref:hypothetical protein n=1 Tax=Sulfolobus acidocaldarius TaxID=2285 RepID=UPI000786557A